jgi:two-component system, NtrC family, sensor kinase
LTPPRSRRPRFPHLAAAELACIGWESLSGLLFATAVSPAVVARPWPVLIFAASFAVSALLAPKLLRSGRVGLALLDFLRACAWALALVPVVELTGWRALLGAGAFGLMASAVRRAIYRYAIDRERGGPAVLELRKSLNDRLAESTFVVGVLAGHILMIFLVAFLRTTNDQIRNAWWQVLPWLTLGGTLIFTLAVPRITAPVLVALESGDTALPSVRELGARRATLLPGQLAWVNFTLWLTCTSVGVFGFRYLAGWTAVDGAIVLAMGLIFAWGISFYQRAWHIAILAPAVEQLRAWGAEETRGRGGSLGRRMLVDFGLPLVFSCALSLFSSLGLYRTLVGSFGASAKEVLALVGSFVVLVVTAGGVIVRAARDLSRPMSFLADAANRVGRGDLEAAVPKVEGPDEVVGLGDSIEHMRRALAKMIAELETERASLEEKVTARTSALSRALAELKEAQAALLHGEKMASLGQLVAGVAHEINNPLNAIAGSVESLADRTDDARRMFDAYRAAEADLPPARRTELERLRAELDLDASVRDLVDIAVVVRRSTDRAVRIVGDLLRFSRASTDRVPTNLHDGMEETLTLLASPLRTAGVAVVKEYGDLPEVLVRTDEVNQVFLNLLTNALQAVAGRQPATIRIRTGTNRGQVEIAIEDDGPGVPANVKTRIFDPFFTTKPAGQGTGLGLSISSQIASRHGGTLTVEDVAGGGARFVLRLPFAPPPRSTPV